MFRLVPADKLRLARCRETLAEIVHMLQLYNGLALRCDRSHGRLRLVRIDVIGAAGPFLKATLLLR